MIPRYTSGQTDARGFIARIQTPKLQNVTANHRANDVIVREGAAQNLVATFKYGPLDMITLTGEKVDIHVMKDPPSGEWILLATEVTDKTGRVSYTIPEAHSVGYGLYPIKVSGILDIAISLSLSSLILNSRQTNLTDANSNINGQLFKSGKRTTFDAIS